MRGTLAVLVAIAALAGGGPAGAGTGCTAVESIESGLAGSDLVVVGVVQTIGDGGRSATVAVDEVWKGDPANTTIEVSGGTPGAISPSDRVFMLGSRYLLFASAGEGGGWTDHACSATRVWDDSLGAFRPAAEPSTTTTSGGFTGTTGAGGISPSTRDGGLAPGVVTAALAAVVAVSIGSLLFRRRPEPGAGDADGSSRADGSS